MSTRSVFSPSFGDGFLCAVCTYARPEREKHTFECAHVVCAACERRMCATGKVHCPFCNRCCCEASLARAGKEHVYLITRDELFEFMRAVGMRAVESEPDE